MLKIGVSKGRIEKAFFDLLIKKNIIDEIKMKSRQLSIKTKNLQILLLKPTDIINFVANNFLDLGVLGNDVIEENANDKIIELYDLETGKCNFSLISKPNKKINQIKTIATKYPNISSKLLKEININCEIVKMEGSLELAPFLSYADAIIDLVETGETLKTNRLEEKIKLYNVSTRIIANKQKNCNDIKNFIKKLN